MRARRRRERLARIAGKDRGAPWRCGRAEVVVGVVVGAFVGAVRQAPVWWRSALHLVRLVPVAECPGVGWLAALGQLLY